MREITRLYIEPVSPDPKPQLRRNPSRLLSLSKEQIESTLNDLRQKLACPLFYSKAQLRGMKKRVRALSARLSDIVDGEIHHEYLISLKGGCVDPELETIRRDEQSRKGKSKLKAKSPDGYRVRPGPKREGGSKPSKRSIMKRLARLS